MTKKGRLYLIPTVLAPETQAAVIADDIRKILPTISNFLVEDVRTSRRYISSLKLGLTIESLKFEVLDRKTHPSSLQKLFKPIFNGYDIGVLSEAGCPGIADPGASAVEYAHSRGVEVIPLVGPSSILLALMASGLNGQKFIFQGYLPIKENERNKAVKTLENESRSRNLTQIFIETPYRNDHMFATIINTASPKTRLCIACNLTAAEQWVKTKTVSDWRKNQPKLHKIPVVFLLQA